jgi:hypothetical protein
LSGDLPTGPWIQFTRFREFPRAWPFCLEKSANMTA